MLAVAVLLIAAEVRSAPELEAGIFAARPVVLSTGELIGPSLGAGWAFDVWSIGARAQLGFASENDLAFNVEHAELRALGFARWIHRVGRGELSLGAGAGVAYLHESRTRHQADRLAASGLPLSSSGSSAGPIFALDASVTVGVVAGLGLVLEGGPSLSSIAGVDEGLRLGWSAGLGLKKSFGDDGADPKR